jgi:Zinc carboxypeptidase
MKLLNIRSHISSVNCRLLQIAICFTLVCGVAGASSAVYRDCDSLSKELVRLTRKYPKMVRVHKLAKSSEKRDVLLVEVGTGNQKQRSTRPAILAVAGIEGNDLAGGSILLSWVSQLASGYQDDAEIRRLLDSTTIYALPRLNMDAAESYFAKARYENSVCTAPVDDDHDGMTDEDSPQDLNGDGLTTWMRVEDEQGEYILDASDSRLLIRANSSKGQIGAWRLLTEGLDDDGDERWNEDGVGGVNFNRNFPYNYKWFAPGSGPHQVSEAETRALADFIIEHRNIGIVITYGAADNLLAADKSINKADAAYYGQLSETYRKCMGLKKPLKSVSLPGTFSDWMYFYRGRLSLAVMPWSQTIQLASSNKKTKKSKKSNEECDFLAWADKNAPGVFVPWQPFTHPDFPGQRVEIGGYAPFARSNPPESMLGDIIKKQASFLNQIIAKLPRIAFRKIETKHLGKGVYELIIQVENTGYLPTVLAQGRTTREVHQTRLLIDLPKEAFLSGSRITRLPPIGGSGGMVEVRQIIHAPSHDKPVEVTVISMLGGTVNTTVKLEQK